MTALFTFMAEHYWIWLISLSIVCQSLVGFVRVTLRPKADK